MKKTDIVFDLFDPSERDHALEVLREAAETGDPCPELIRPVKSYVQAPLESWLQGARPGNETAEAATAFWFAVHDVLERLRDGGLHLAHVNPLADAWVRFHLLAGYDGSLSAAKHSQVQSARASKPRKKTKELIMAAVRQTKGNQDATNREIWHSLYYVLEDEFGDIRRTGKEKQSLTLAYHFEADGKPQKPLKFKRFKTIMSDIRNEL